MSEMSRVRHDYYWKQIEMDISQMIISLHKLHGPLTFLKGSTLLPQVSLSDNAPSHRKIHDNALNADKMNVSLGGKQPKMRDMVWDGGVQIFVDNCGDSKRHEGCVGREGSGYHRHEGQGNERSIKTFSRF